MAIIFVCNRFTTPGHLVVDLTTITVMYVKYCMCKYVLTVLIEL